MFVLISHILGFLGLSAAAIFDLKTTEVPDYLSLFVIGSGLLFHGLASINQGSLTPIIWSIGAGLIFGLYGWGMYYLGMWGGADAFVMNSLGFAAPFAINDIPSIVYSVDLFVNIMLAGFAYTIGFSFYKAAKSQNIVRNTFQKLSEQKIRVTAELIGGILVSVIISQYTSLRGSIYLVLMIGLIFLFRFLKVIENAEMKQTIPVSKLEPGEVVETEEIEMGNVRQENLVGATISKIQRLFDFSFLQDIKERYGYSEIVGITSEEIESLKDEGVENVEVKEGVRFVPVFPVALLLTDTVGAGVFLVSNLIN